MQHNAGSHGRGGNITREYFSLLDMIFGSFLCGFRNPQTTTRQTARAFQRPAQRSWFHRVATAGRRDHPTSSPDRGCAGARVFPSSPRRAAHPSLSALSAFASPQYMTWLPHSLPSSPSPLRSRLHLLELFSSFSKRFNLVLIGDDASSLAFHLKFLRAFLVSFF